MHSFHDALQGNEGAQFWLSVLTELKNRDVEDILIACIDGLKGFHEAIEAVYPNTQVQLCVVHMVRNSMRFVSWKDYKRVASQLRTIHHANKPWKPLNSLEGKLSIITEQWRHHRNHLITMFNYPEDIHWRSIRPMPLSQSTALFEKRSLVIRCSQTMRPL